MIDANVSGGTRRRATPTQKRSTVTFEKILEAAGTILLEGGLQALNTNSVAEVAGVNVATLYHYFSDKNAILSELYLRDQTVRTRYFQSTMANLAGGIDLREWVEGVIHNLVRLRRDYPASAGLRRACRAVPELVELEKNDSEHITRELSRALRSRFPHLSPARSRLVSITVVETGAALLDRASFEPSLERGIARELVAILNAYLCDVEASASDEPSKRATRRVSGAPAPRARRQFSGG